jgi:hypothetical protein
VPGSPYRGVLWTAGPRALIEDVTELQAGATADPRRLDF